MSYNIVQVDFQSQRRLTECALFWASAMIGGNLPAARRIARLAAADTLREMGRSGESRNKMGAMHRVLRENVERYAKKQGRFGTAG